MCFQSELHNLITDTAFFHGGILVSLPEIVIFSLQRDLLAEENLKKGYIEMAGINLAIANMCLNTDNQQMSVYEEKLAESEKY